MSGPVLCAWARPQGIIPTASATAIAPAAQLALDSLAAFSTLPPFATAARILPDILPPPHAKARTRTNPASCRPKPACVGSLSPLHDGCKAVHRGFAGDGPLRSGTPPAAHPQSAQRGAERSTQRPAF